MFHLSPLSAPNAPRHLKQSNKSTTEGCAARDVFELWHGPIPLPGAVRAQLTHRKSRWGSIKRGAGGSRAWGHRQQLRDHSYRQVGGAPSVFPSVHPSGAFGVPWGGVLPGLGGLMVLGLPTAPAPLSPSVAGGRWGLSARGTVENVVVVAQVITIDRTKSIWMSTSWHKKWDSRSVSISFAVAPCWFLNAVHFCYNLSWKIQYKLQVSWAFKLLAQLPGKGKPGAGCILLNMFPEPWVQTSPALCQLCGTPAPLHITQKSNEVAASSWGLFYLHNNTKFLRLIGYHNHHSLPEAAMKPLTESKQACKFYVLNMRYYYIMIWFL